MEVFCQDVDRHAPQDVPAMASLSVQAHTSPVRGARKVRAKTSHEKVHSEAETPRQRVSRETVSSSYDREAAPTTSQQQGSLQKTWKTAIPTNVLACTGEI